MLRTLRDGLNGLNGLGCPQDFLLKLSLLKLLIAMSNVMFTHLNVKNSR